MSSTLTVPFKKDVSKLKVRVANELLFKVSYKGVWTIPCAVVEGFGSVGVLFWASSHRVLGPFVSIFQGLLLFGH